MGRSSCARTAGSRFTGGAVLSRALLLAALAAAGCSNHPAQPAPPDSPSWPALDLLDLRAGTPVEEAVLPPGWEPYQFEKIPRATRYDVVFEDGSPALRARALSSASALRRRIAVDPRRLPLLEWSWKVGGLPGGADIRTREGDDCAARVLLLYRYDSGRASLLDRARFESARSIRGEYPPAAMLVYVWAEAGKAAAGALSSPSSDRIKVIPVEAGADRAGQWITERRDHLEDYRRAFGEEPPDLEAVALMADTDNTGSEATAWFRKLRLYGS